MLSRYLSFRECRNSQPEIDNFPTDKLFTGQRLDGTGLYYYNARYYDPSIGRFISADIIIPNPSDPQSYNRYAYVLNNPLKFVDPSGRDLIVVGGNRRDSSEPGWVGEMKDNLNIKEGEQFLFIGDTDGGHVLKAGDQYEELKGVLESGDYSDIKIIGFSEGAAATVMILDDIAKGADYGDIRLAVMLETPNVGLVDYDNDKRKDLPNRLAGDTSGNRGIVVGDFRNKASWISSDPGWDSGVDSYYDPFLDPWMVALYWSIDWRAGAAATTIDQIENHCDVTTDQHTYDYVNDMLWDLGL
ncbi:RHS repeat-associated core domain-containing protein [Chloroflexota bacterium]